MGTPDHSYSTATELPAAIDAGEVSAVELTQAAIDRIEQYDAPINAISVRDFDRALAQPPAEHRWLGRSPSPRWPCRGMDEAPAWVMCG